MRGEDGRDWLADQLRAAGATVRPVAAYRRVVARLDAAELALLSSALATPANCCWIFSSSEAVGNLRRLAPGLDPAASVALASHPRIAQAAREAGFVDVRLVAPQTDAVVAALRPAQERAA